MKLLFGALVLALIGPSSLVRANSGNSLLWNAAEIRTENGIALQVAVDNEGKLIFLKIQSDTKEYEIPKSVFCMGTSFDLRSIDVYQTFGESGKVRSDLNLAINSLGTDDSGSILQYEFEFSQTSLVSYRILSLGDDGSIRAVKPSTELAPTCDQRN